MSTDRSGHVVMDDDALAHARRILGLTADNDVEHDAVSLRRAYRHRLLSAHPDHGGDAFQLEQVRSAYRLLVAAGDTRTPRIPTTVDGAADAADAADRAVVDSATDIGAETSTAINAAARIPQGHLQRQVAHAAYATAGKVEPSVGTSATGTVGFRSQTTSPAMSPSLFRRLLERELERQVTAHAL